MGMAIWGTMTGPLLVVLHTMPAAVFAGVFFVVGVCIHRLFIRFLSATNHYLVGLHRIQWHSGQDTVPGV